eukprot:CAMPEP_0177759904 /NCGR_PEP_ID=MMETSP0491_2-20121128/4981_1 /TAXON_ID=63592 /ORGANISM="Tetraselmis chuii, Strain PLY429" /LENGTH=289 /DNA_ID=CAMNT_0019275765 /DNA_START=204 /DNA_END=1073 /DNA_ORIENTATION=+
MSPKAQGDVSEEQVTELRAFLPPEHSKTASDSDLRRFIRAQKGDVPSAAKRLIHTSEWRKKEGVESIVCKACIQNPRSHYMHVAGLDLFQRPVIYSVFNLAEDKAPETNRLHMIHQFETAVRLMPEGVEKWVWVMDFHGFGFADCNPKIGKIFLDITASHYPERLGAIIVAGAPGLFNGMWSVLRPLVDDVTKQKIRFLPYDVDSKSKGQQLRDGMKDIFGEELIDWMVAEMADNRRQKGSMKKAYSCTDLDSPVPHGQHDHRGTASLLRMMSANAHLLTGHQAQTGSG